MQGNKIKFSIQDFIKTRLYIGKSQYKELISLALVEINDGMQAITISLLTPILQQHLHLDQNQVSFLTSIFYVGVGLGAIVAGIYSNIYGRRKILLLGSVIQLISSVLLAFYFSYSWLCVCRLLYGIGFGSTLAVATVIITELMPIHLRGKTLLIINFINSLGKLGSIGLAFIFIEGSNKQISEYMFASATINLVAVILVFYYVKQSFRFLLFKRKLQETFQILNQIIKQNNRNNDQLSNYQKQSLQAWSFQTFQSNKHVNTSKLIWQQKRIVILLSISSFFINFIFFGQMFIIPFMVGQQDHGLIKYFWMTLGQLPALLLTYTLIERQGWGRRRSLVFFFASSALFCFTAIQFFNSITLFFTKMFMKAIFQMIAPFASQSYSTSIRSIAYAINSLFGRIGATIMPFIIYPLYNHYPNSPFLLLAILSLLGAFSILTIRKDTLGKPLDQQKQNDQGNFSFTTELSVDRSKSYYIQQEQ